MKRNTAFKHNTAFGIATAVALVAMAFFGVSSASATSTQLCKVHTEPCPAASAVTSLHLVNKGDVTFEVKFVGTIVAKCAGSLVKASVLGLAKPQVAHIDEWTWTGCATEGGTPCDFKTVVTGSYNILKTFLNLGTGELVNLEVHVECKGLAIDCFVTANGKSWGVEGSGHTAGAGNGMFTITKAPLNQTKGVFCPANSAITALYEPLEKVFIVS